ncbi:MAG: transglycosylase domain-containing protein, partial [candidate division NC10 bacterium]
MLEKRAAHLIRGERHKTIRYRWIGRGSISPDMRLAVVASEDQKFPHHRGFDFESIAEAVLEKDARGRLR